MQHRRGGLEEKSDEMVSNCLSDLVRGLACVPLASPTNSTSSISPLKELLCNKCGLLLSCTKHDKPFSLVASHGIYRHTGLRGGGGGQNYGTFRSKEVVAKEGTLTSKTDSNKWLIKNA